MPYDPDLPADFALAKAEVAALSAAVSVHCLLTTVPRRSPRSTPQLGKSGNVSQATPTTPEPRLGDTPGRTIAQAVARPAIRRLPIFLPHPGSKSPYAAKPRRHAWRRDDHHR
mmetsp:Transcript_67689/g.162492  ORF Transcript_67689/g.162492 Transcript_67689/m.162492 type:complete len:113 (+) Transcript_67689:600-938(+)